MACRAGWLYAHPYTAIHDLQGQGLQRLADAGSTQTVTVLGAKQGAVDRALYKGVVEIEELIGQPIDNLVVDEKIKNQFLDLLFHKGEYYSLFDW